jgi:hypothetical protein
LKEEVLFPFVLSSAIFLSFIFLNIFFYAIKVDAGGKSAGGNEARTTRSLSKPELANYALAVAWSVVCLGLPFVEPDCSFCDRFSQPVTVVLVIACVLVAGVMSLSGLRIAQRLRDYKRDGV